MYLPRTIAATLERVSAAFPVVLLTGPRQVGKTTAMRACAGGQRAYVTLDDPDERDLARRDPALFFQRHTPPVLVDEVQYAPQLFARIKLLVDRDRKPGMFWLTGSQKFHLMEGVAETLAGRVAILDLQGLSQAELEGRPDAPPFLPTAQWVAQARQRARFVSVAELYARIWRGAFPEVALRAEVPWEVFYRSYLDTYVLRDVRALARVGDEGALLRLVRAAAARSGQLLNLADLARDVAVDPKTVKAWLAFLETAGLIYLLPPYHTNVTARAIKTPKLYVLDTGLMAYLTRWSSPEALEAGAMAGAALETWVVAEILKGYWHHGLDPHLYFYRDKDGVEVDLILERDGVLYPVECKKTASPGREVLRPWGALARRGLRLGAGAVLCLRETDIPLTAEVTAIPVGYL